MLARDLVDRREVEDRALPGHAIRLVLLTEPYGVFEHVQSRLARSRQRTALHERLEHALVRDRRVDALGEVPDRLERPVLFARSDDRAARTLAHALHGVEP